jgi:hypothetical protein
VHCAPHFGASPTGAAAGGEIARTGFGGRRERAAAAAMPAPSLASQLGSQFGIGCDTLLAIFAETDGAAIAVQDHAKAAEALQAALKVSELACETATRELEMLQAASDRHAADGIFCDQEAW